MKKDIRQKGIITATLLAVYFGAYYLLVHPILVGPPENRSRVESYINPLMRSEARNAAPFQYFFCLAHQVDVLVRRDFWFPK